MTTLLSADHHAALWAVMALGTALAIWLEQTYRWAGRLSGPVVALLIAMLLSNARIIPTDAPAYDFVGAWLVPLAIPLLLCRANLRELKRMGGRIFVVFHISAIGTVLGTMLAWWSLRSALGSPDSAHAAGMMAASYIGGGVNFMAVKTSYAVEEGLAANLIVADNFVMAGMFVALLALGASKWMLAKFHCRQPTDEAPAGEGNRAASHWKRKEIGLLDLARSIGFAFAVVAIASGIKNAANAGFASIDTSGLLMQIIQVLATNTFVLITFVTLFLATIFARTLEKIQGPEELGTYFLFLFLFTLGIPTDFASVIQKAPLLFVFCGIIAVVNLVFTLGVGKIFRLDLRELLVAINANLGGSPSAAAMAISAGWPRLVLPGILAGIWGYAIGTPIGVMFIEILLSR
jgi:uncharacterized membrane protein